MPSCLQVLSRSNVAMAIAQESNRIRPSVKVVHRKANQDTTVGNVQVPADTQIAVAVGAVRFPSRIAATTLSCVWV